MHEMGIAMQIIEIAKSSIPENAKDKEIFAVNIQAGKLTAIIPDNLKFCFSIATKNTPLEGAILNITEIPVKAKCKKCKYEWTIKGPDFICKKCKNGDIDILSGQELDIISIELKD